MEYVYESGTCEKNIATPAFTPMPPPTECNAKSKLTESIPRLKDVVATIEDSIDCLAAVLLGVAGPVPTNRSQNKETTCLSDDAAAALARLEICREKLYVLRDKL